MILIACLIILATLFAIFLKQQFEQSRYFKKLNIKYVEPVLFFGNSFQTFIGNKHQSQIIEEVYSKFPNEDLVGFFDFIKPCFILRSPELINQIMIKDFSYFGDRIKPLGDIQNPGDASLFILSGNTWRAVRSKFSPLFTSGKLKYMYNSIKECGNNLISVLNKNDGKEIDMGEIMCLFTMDVIGSCAFGIDAGTLQNPQSKFRTMGKRLFQTTFLGGLRSIIFFMKPTLAKAIGIGGFFPDDIVNYFCNIISNTMKQRKAEGLERNDFVQMLIQLQEKGKIEMQVHDQSDDYLKFDKATETCEIQLTDDILLGGGFSFLTAGFHATAMSLTFTLYELSQYPEIVKKLREEINEKVCGEDVTYDDLKTMTYLEKVIKESMRLHPAALFIGRVCTKDYTFPNGHTITPGMSILIPVSALHKDLAYFPDPLSFNPDRFDSDPLPGTYLPFGDGPRICIAMRFAILEMKFAIAKIVKSFDFRLSESTKIPLQLRPRDFLATPKDQIMLLIKKIRSST